MATRLELRGKVLGGDVEPVLARSAAFATQEGRIVTPAAEKAFCVKQQVGSQNHLLRGPAIEIDIGDVVIVDVRSHAPLGNPTAIGQAAAIHLPAAGQVHPDGKLKLGVELLAVPAVLPVQHGDRSLHLVEVLASAIVQFLRLAKFVERLVAQHKPVEFAAGGFEESFRSRLAGVLRLASTAAEEHRLVRPRHGALIGVSEKQHFAAEFGPVESPGPRPGPEL